MLDFVFVVHNHQPVGNFEAVFRRGMEHCYIPFLKAALEEPEFRFGLHTSGVLLEYAERRAPEYLDLIERLLERDQVELICGGFYEPILPILPERDVIGQVEMYREWMRRRFGVEPRGMWMAERVWDQSVIRLLWRLRIRYTLLDDTHFHWAGVFERDVLGHFLAEHVGDVMAVLPMNERLRYLIPFSPVEETIAHLGKFRGRDTIITYGDDGEKFGVWKNTKRIIYDRKWFSRFMRAVKGADWLRMALPCEALGRHEPRGRIYLPEAAYRELTEWALPPDAHRMYQAAKRRLGENGKMFVRGASFRSFFVKYREAARMYGRMLGVSRRVAAELDEAKRRRAEIPLWRAQCNCAYWHGDFGGIHFPFLRRAVYENLLEAEEEAGDENLSVHRVEVVPGAASDVRMDGVLLRAFVDGGDFNVYELDYLPARRNLGDLLSRYRQDRPGGCRSADAGPRDIGVFYIVPPGVKPASLRNPRWRAACRVRLEGAAEMQYLPAALETSADIVLEAPRVGPVRLNKRIRLRRKEARLIVSAIVANPQKSPLRFTLVVESNLAVPRETAELEADANKLPAGRLSVFGRGALSITDTGDGPSVLIRADGAEGLVYPVVTRMQKLFATPGVTVTTHQGYCVVYAWDLTLEPEEVAIRELRIDVREN